MEWITTRPIAHRGLHRDAAAPENSLAAFEAAIAVNRRRQTLVTSTLQQYRSRFRSTLREILNLKPKSPEGQRLLKCYQKIREHLLLFLDDETVPPTNNSGEQALRWSVVFRKVTHGFCSDWGA